MPDFRDLAGPGRLEVDWHAGWPSAKHDPAPEIQVHAYDPHTRILRQNKSVNYEAPFMFLLFGNARALLLDTGATADPAYFPLRRTVDELIAAWLADHPRDDYGLTLAFEGSTVLSFPASIAPAILAKMRCDKRIEFISYSEYLENVLARTPGAHWIRRSSEPGHGGSLPALVGVRAAQLNRQRP